MSANDHTTAPEYEEAHTGPIKTPKQLLQASALFFVLPIFIIIGLVFTVTKGNKPAAGAGDSQAAITERIKRVGYAEVRDANRPLRSGEEVYKAQCTACHAAGLAGAPKTGDVAAWAPRIKTGYEALWASSLKGKGAMGAQGGGEYNDTEIGRAVVYLTAAAGGKFAIPGPPAGAAPAAAAAASAPAAAAVAPVAAAAPAVAIAATPATPAAPAAVKVAAAGKGEALYNQVCTACHAQSVAGSPKFGDKAAWAPRIKTGVDALTASVIKGKGAMPAKGGSAASDADIRATVEYMVNAAK